MRASKQLLSTEMIKLKEFIESYRSNLTEDVFNSQEFSIKLIQIPKISNSNRNDLSIEFVNWDQLNRDDKEKYDSLLAIVKPKLIKH
ncbi:MAG: hypothetical protein PQJ49_01960 [Sphaerochaetaceae bacterium]|nr:hypothetical protein [Sphaerochaetaceae bacterium]